MPALSALPALPVTSLVISWPQDQVGGNSIFYPPSVLYPQLPDGIYSGLDFCPHREPSAAGCTQCFHPIRVCRCWAVAEDGRVGWVFVASWQERECYPLTTGGDRPTATQPSYYEVIHPTLQLLLPVFTPIPRGNARLVCLCSEPHQDIDLPAWSWTGLLSRGQRERGAHVMQNPCLAGNEGGAEEHCVPLAWALQLGWLQKGSL